MQTHQLEIKVDKEIEQIIGIMLAMVLLKCLTIDVIGLMKGDNCRRWAKNQVTTAPSKLAFR